jgi:uncharacterized protein YutE (UPF0331/DUF86 family)
VTPDRPRRSAEQLRESYDETLEALRRRFEQLESAVAQFPPDLDEPTFVAAWHSADPHERNRADGVLSSFEKTYMLLMDLITLSVKLSRRLGVVSIDEKASPVDTLSQLKILSTGAAEALRVQREVRNASQHVYVELSLSSLREAVRLQLESAPRLIQGIVGWVDSVLEGPADDAE